MQKISITLNVSKIDKSKIIERKYTNKEGNEVIEKLYKFDLIEAKEPKFVAQGDTWVMKKTHFGAETFTKEEKANKKEPNYVAEGFTFEKKDEPIVDPTDGRELSENPFDM